MNFNKNVPFFSSFTPQTLVEICQWRALHQPQEQIYTFLVDEKESASMTYAELDSKARTIAAHLQSLRVVGERALILYPPGMEYIVAFFGCLYAGVVAVPAYPPHMNRSVSRLLAIIEDAKPKVILTDTHTLADITRRFSQISLLEQSHWIATDTLEASLADMWVQPHISGDSLAFLQYSSGSTNAPKGIMLSHKNLLHNVAAASKRTQTSFVSRGITWLPPYHDMGLIGCIIQPLQVGFPVVLMSPFSFLQRPFRWLHAISRYRGTHSAAPNFAYTLCVDKITPEERASLDLSCWEMALFGAEPINAETLNRFAETFAPCGFKREALYPAYGLAEATLFVTGGSLQAEPIVKTFSKKDLLLKHVVPASSPNNSDAKAFVGCGHPLEDQQLLIVDPQTLQRCSPDQIGEIWVAGSSIAQGYWNKPEESTRDLQAFLHDTNEGPFLRTGDAGFLQDGELFISGRLKDLIIIRGDNYFPQDIEITAGKSHPFLRQEYTAAFSVTDEDEEQLVIVQEVDRRYRDLDIEAICQAIRQEVVSQHNVVAYTIVLVKHGSIPKTSSGKTQRYLCREDFLAQRLSVLGESSLAETYPLLSENSPSRYVAPRTPTERMLAEIWQEVLGVERVGIEDNFFALGGQSVLAAQLISRVQEVLQREISIRALFENATISGFMEQLEAAEDDTEADHEPELVPLERMRYLASEA